MKSRGLGNQFRNKIKGVNGVATTDGLIGWNTGDGNQFGFAPSEVNGPIWYRGDAHQCTFGITGSGKGVNAAIPHALTHHGGNLVCNDSKGEIYAVTSRFRRDVLCQKVVLLDPFKVTGASECDGINPFDLATIGTEGAYEVAALIATMVAGSTGRTTFARNSTNDEFWMDSGVNLLTGCIGSAMEGKLEGGPNLGSVLQILKSDDPIYALAQLLDSNPPSKPFSREIAAFLNITDVTRSGILATVQSYFRSLGGERVCQMLEKTTFDLPGFLSGDSPASIYIVIPPEKLISHARLLRLIYGTILNALFARRFIPNSRTLLLIDEAASLSQFEPLQNALTLMRGNGCVVHSLWQDVSQISGLYHDYNTILNNHGLIRVLGASNYAQAERFGEILGVSARSIMNLEPNEQMLLVDGNVIRCQRLNYLKDSCFAGRFEANPRYVEQNRKSKSSSSPENSK